MVTSWHWNALRKFGKPKVWHKPLLEPWLSFSRGIIFFISRHVSFLFQDIQTTAIPAEVNASIPEPKKGAAEAINTPESDKGSAAAGKDTNKRNTTDVGINDRATQAMKTGGVRDGSTDRDIYTYVAIGVGLALFLATTILVATTCWKYRAGRLSTLNGIH